MAYGCLSGANTGMALRPSLRSMWLAILVAVGLHAVAAGCWLLPSGDGVAGRPATAARAVTLVWSERQRAVDSPATPAQSQAQVTAPAPPDPRDSSSVPVTGTVARDTRPSRQEALPAPPKPASALGAVPGAAQLLEPAYLAGEPLINLNEDEASIDGSIALRLSIDETGHVVDSRVSSRDGLSDAAVEILVRSFTGYVYVPARRAGRPVPSDVTVIVGVRDGRGVTALSP